jgi:hypothetical protein
MSHDTPVLIDAEKAIRVEPIEPEPPKGIHYLLGRESWLKESEQTPLRLHVEEWGNLGPMELNPEIPKNAAGFRMRGTDILAPGWARGFTRQDDRLVWTSDKRHGEPL